MIRTTFISLSLLLISVTAICQQAPYTFEGHKIKSAEKLFFNIPVVSLSKDSTYIPVTIIHGKKPGPVLGLMAGVHGFEYPPIIAMQEMAAKLNPDSISGTVIIIQIANVKAFFGRSVYYNPADGKNLNREFPGDSTGSITQCIAHVITHRILPKLNYFADVHAGDASEDLHDYVAYSDQGQQAQKAQQMAVAMQLDWIIRSSSEIKAGEPTRYGVREALSQGIPTIAIECGGLGKVTRTQTDKINNGLLNVMRAIQLLPGKVNSNEHPLIITRQTYISAPTSGIFYTTCKSGQIITKGMKLGYITDLYGHVVHEVFSPVDGFIVYNLSTPPVNKDEILFSLGVF